ncbi:MAG: hypothetical protein KF764_16585 [Labilithrix sp.]|nr:hypothetical protein [Labilithrix sp.]MBX3220949.1 hypothetical protein [Labilithrix sp.]
MKRQHIEEWTRLASDLAAFDSKLVADAAQFIQASASRAGRRPIAGPARIALAAVYDDHDVGPSRNQLAGGRRADWLASRFKTGFTSIGGVLPRPKAWAAPEPAPDGFDLVVVGRLFKRGGVQMPRVDVSWTGYAPDGRQLEISSGSFPEAAAPRPPPTPPPALPTSEGLFLSMDSDHHGSICAGETTQLWLKTTETLHVRVFDLYGTDGAILLFPTQGRSDVVSAGKTIPLGDESGFEAFPLPGMEDERYLVIASPTPAGLGRFAAVKETCRLAPAEGDALHRGANLPPGARTAVTGYRVLTGGSCPRPPSAERQKAALSALARVPICPR